MTGRLPYSFPFSCIALLNKNSCSDWKRLKFILLCFPSFPLPWNVALNKKTSRISPSGSVALYKLSFLQISSILTDVLVQSTLVLFLLQKDGMLLIYCLKGARKKWSVCFILLILCFVPLLLLRESVRFSLASTKSLQYSPYIDVLSFPNRT